MRGQGGIGGEEEGRERHEGTGRDRRKGGRKGR